MLEPNRIVIIGAGGQLGRELVRTLAAVYGENSVVASDINEDAREHFNYYHFEPLNVFATERMDQVIQKHGVRQIYHLAACHPYETSEGGSCPPYETSEGGPNGQRSIPV